jgi:DNA mismatch repair protein MutS
MAELTPMMQKYVETKEQYKDCILFYRLGDFYEMFFEDALTASKELEITLTGKSCGLEERAPMCGVPYHAVELYLNKLVSKGYKVAICEQVEDPKQAKGLVKREVVRIVTPGTNLNAQALDEKKNNYLMSIASAKNKIGVAICDLTTGEFRVTDTDRTRRVYDEIEKYQPSEIIYSEKDDVLGNDGQALKERLGIAVYPQAEWYFEREMCAMTLRDHFHVHSLDGLGLSQDVQIRAAGSLLKYLMETQKSSLLHIGAIHPYQNERYMVLDSASRRNLELVETLREKKKTGSLLWVLDKTNTAMGARLLRSYLEQPLIHTDEIKLRQDAVSELLESMITREELREYMQSIYDLERLIGRISLGTANPRDFIALKHSLEMLVPIQTLLLDFHSPLMQQIAGQLDTLEDICSLIEDAIEEEPKITLHDGGIIKAGFHEEVDRLRSAGVEGKNWLADIEEREKQRTGIKTLKVKFNKVFGYYIEVTKSFLSQVPDDYVRKQTLTNAERFITPELKELENTILGSEDRLSILEYDLFITIRDSVSSEVGRIQQTAHAIAQLDVYASLAQVAQKNHYCKPKVADDGVISLKDARHPVVEKMMPDGSFIANDLYLDPQSRRVAIITGPNMAGKSTYMRQAALIVLMAQIGSYVPASEAHIGIVDRVFTRVGASDDLASGQSTFMVEMNEVANILNNATKNSLLILDEIGRGTSTYDGLAIAWAVVEYICDLNKLGAKTLFATHYHELTVLEEQMDCVHNYSIAVKEEGDDIIFLRKIIPQGADRSYGIQVAKLAGVPDVVIDRAKQILTELISDKPSHQPTVSKPESDSTGEEELRTDKMTGKDAETNLCAREIAAELKALNLSTITPLEAINLLYQLQEKLQ